MVLEDSIHVRMEHVRSCTIHWLKASIIRIMIIIECVYKKRRNSFPKNYPDSQSCGNFGRTRKLQRSKTHYFSSLSDTINPEKKIRAFSSLFFQPAQQHDTQTAYLAPHSRQEKLLLYEYSLNSQTDTR